MSICSIPLPPDCEKELNRLVDCLSDGDLAMLAAMEPAFQTGGFRNSKPPIIRTRIHQLVTGSQPISESLRKTLAKRSRMASLAELLPSHVLCDNRHAFVTLSNAHTFLVALLLDARADIREKAEAWMKDETPFLSLAPEDALTQLRNLFEPLTELLGASATDGIPVTQDAWRAQKEQLDLRIRDLNEQNRRLRGVDDKLAGLSRQLKTSETQLASTKDKLDEAEKTLRQKNAETEKLVAALNKETANRDERLTAALDLALAKEFFGWLGTARALEAQAQAIDPYADVLKQAEAALAHQTELDRHTGNRMTLESRLTELEQMQSRIIHTLEYAIRQSPDLKRIEDVLSSEIEKLRMLLYPADSLSPIENLLIERIHVAPDNALPALRPLPDLMTAAGLLPQGANGRVQAAFRKRFGAIQALGVMPDPEIDSRKSSVSLLGRALAGQQPAMLLVDGHNALFGLPTRYNPQRGSAASEGDKRNKLATDIIRITAPNPAVRVWIVFDGPQRMDTQASPNVRVTYSGGEGEHRADAVLLDNIKFFRAADPKMAVLLVSNDSDLCKEAARQGAQIVSVMDLGMFFT
ncbi:MAG: hypothetical protein WCP12_02680 [bacterium]